MPRNLRNECEEMQGYQPQHDIITHYYMKIVSVLTIDAYAPERMEAF